MTTTNTMRGVGASAVLAGIAASVLLAYLAMPGDARADTTMPLCEIQRGLAVGATGEDVRCLQRYLNWAGFTVAAAGPGSPGNETAYYGSLTENAVARWQDANAATVLVPIGLRNGTGYWGSSSFSRYVTLVRVALSV